MKKLYTLFTILVAMFFVIGANAQTATLSVAELTGRWKFNALANAPTRTVQNNNFEYVFNANSTITYKWGEVRPYTIKGKDIIITDKYGAVSYVHVEKFNSGVMTAITDYNTPKASTPMIFKKVK